MRMNNENARNYAYIFTCHEECQADRWTDIIQTSVNGKI